MEFIRMMEFKWKKLGNGTIKENEGLRRRWNEEVFGNIDNSIDKLELILSRLDIVAKMNELDKVNEVRRALLGQSNI